MEAEATEVIEEETAENVEEVDGDGDIQTEDDNDTEGEEEQDGEESEEGAELEPWEITGEEENTEKPEKTLKQKKAWKREKQKVNEELERIKAENEALKAATSNPQPTDLKRPDPLDFEDDESYEDAKEKYLIEKIRREDQAAAIAQRNQKFIDKRKAGVAEHNERVGEFIEEKNINPEIYSNAENVFISALEDAFPKKGELIADDFLSKLGSGSEKIPYFLGRNKAKLAEFREVLKEDPSGIKAGIFLGEENARLRGVATGKQKSKAPKPAKTATGNVNVKTGNANAKNIKKKYDEAFKAGNGALAFSLKRQAKKEHKIDTKDW